METIQALVDQVSQRLASPKSRNTVVSIGAALSLILLYLAADRAVRPPRKLRHIPYMNYIQFMKMALQRKPTGEISRTLAVPLMEGYGQRSVFLRPDRLGWMLHIANPEAAKQFFMKTGESSLIW